MKYPILDLFARHQSNNADASSNNNASEATINEAELAIWLGLNNVPQMGFLRLSAGAKKVGCELHELPVQSACTLTAAGFTSAQINAMIPHNKLLIRQLKQTMAWLQQSSNHHFIPLNSDKYPALLKTITRPPLFLFVAGNLELLAQPLIAFVGSRKPSLYATQVTYDLVRSLAQLSCAKTVSGLALGIDAACHKASLANDLPTIGVLGCGVDVVYPKRHQALYQEVQQNGALVSEFLLGTQPVASMFPRRNRIISGLSLGTIVVEAQIKSGSLVTAKYALEQNREIFAVPNNIGNPNAHGCHWLIKQGAQLTDCIEDVLGELPCIAITQNNEHETQKNKKNVIEDLASNLLLDSVTYSATPVDMIAQRTGMPLSDVLLKLLEYEMRGIVASTAEGYVKLRG